MKLFDSNISHNITEVSHDRRGAWNQRQPGCISAAFSGWLKISALRVLCEGNPPVTEDFSYQDVTIDEPRNNFATSGPFY